MYPEDIDASLPHGEWVPKQRTRARVSWLPSWHPPRPNLPTRARRLR